MAEYIVNDRNNTTTLNLLNVMANGLPTTPKNARALVAFAARKDITYVPMGWCLSGPVNGVLKTGLATDGLSDCDGLFLVGGTGAGTGFSPQQASFTHIQGGNPDCVNWSFLLKDVQKCGTVYAVISIGASSRKFDYIYKHVKANIVPKTNILVYTSGTGNSGRNFAVNGALDIGEYDAKLVTRESSKPQSQLEKSNYIAQNPGVTTSEPTAVKVPKK